MAVVISDQLLDRGERLLEAEPDEHLVALAQSGHDAAFAAIVRRYEPELLAKARRLSSDGRGEDAVQQAFLNAFAALQAGSEVRHLRGWLHQILRHAVIRARVPAEAPLEAASAYGESLEETVQRRAQAHATLAELSALPARQRDALLGTAILGFPRAQVAQRMGLSEGAVRQLVHRARLRLREAATALVPFPLGRFFGGGGGAGSEAVAGAGAAASGGVAIKVGTLLASGVLATGLAVTQSLPGQHHRAGAARVTRHPTTPVRGVRRLMEAPAVRAGAISAGPAARPALHAQAGTPHGGPPLTASGGRYGGGESHQGPALGRGRYEGPPGGSGRGHDGGARGSAGDGGGSTSSPGDSGSGGGDSGSGRDGSGSGDGTSVTSPDSAQPTALSGSGDGAPTGGSDSSSGGSSGSSTGSQGSTSGSDGSSTSMVSSGGGDGFAGSSSDGSGSGGGQNYSGGSRDVSGSAGSSSP